MLFFALAWRNLCLLLRGRLVELLCCWQYSCELLYEACLFLQTDRERDQLVRDNELGVARLERHRVQPYRSLS